MVYSLYKNDKKSIVYIFIIFLIICLFPHTKNKIKNNLTFFFVRFMCMRLMKPENIIKLIDQIVYYLIFFLLKSSTTLSVSFLCSYLKNTLYFLKKLNKRKKNILKKKKAFLFVLKLLRNAL